MECVSVMSSTSFAVISDSSRPTIAIPREYGAMICSVSSVNGTSGNNRCGRESGNRPISETVGTLIPVSPTTALITRMVINGAGTAPESLGHPSMIAMPAATRT